MQLPEIEAKKRLCPFTIGTAHEHNCVGSGCMAWEGDYPVREKRVAGDPPPEGEGWIADGQPGRFIQIQAWYRLEGFCGRLELE